MTDVQVPSPHTPARPGLWLDPGDSGYDQARRVWNAMHDRHPARIARCRSAADIGAALHYAAASGLKVTVRGGGHNVAGTAVADGAILIDLSPMRGVTVDPATAVAQAQGGCLLSDLDAATTVHGLACPAGVVSHTGLAGLALGGGYGWLARTWGLTCDHLLAAEVVLADGTVVEATEDRHPDLLWALRGGGGNFGVVTRFTLRLRPVGPVHQHVGIYPLDDAGHALAVYRTFAARQPVQLHTVGALKFAGRDDWIPSPLRGRPALFLTAAWFGDSDDGPATTAPLFRDAPPAAATARLLTYAQLQAQGDHGEPHGHRYYTKSCYLDELSEPAMTQFVHAAGDMASARSSIDFEYLQGAITDTPDTDSAFPRRDAKYIFTASAQWTSSEHDEENIGWARRSAGRLDAFRSSGAYLNYLQDEPEGKILEVFGAARHRRLAEVKRIFDPGNVFRGNQNIAPAVGDQ